MISETLQNPYFVRLYLFINIDKAHFMICNYSPLQNCKQIGPHFLYFFGRGLGGGGGVRKENGGKKIEIRKCLDDF